MKASDRIRSTPAILLALLCGILAGCTTSTAAVNGARVTVAHFPGVGRILTDQAGYTLYVYLPDDRGPSKCMNLCAKQWPPLLLPQGVRRPTSGPGVDKALLGVTRRRNGSLQITYNSWPLYVYRDDGQGQVTGQGEGMGAWYVLSPDGAIDRQPVGNVPSH